MENQLIVSADRPTSGAYNLNATYISNHESRLDFVFSEDLNDTTLICVDIHGPDLPSASSTTLHLNGMIIYRSTFINRQTIGLQIIYE